ncbi:MAG: transcription antitermination factor NusB [Gemmatimonadetes bacterium]|nr:transcription antitermination factor NusB [Gemmatimonadota bacterium]MBP6670508.1 transcription antitermination factor NusB [Gemmatimonadales bacterium]MBK6778817.1 transcription antitermination factor NusB [Gemmatimonadota bacterium]MBK7348872.1 transcription antitermination factor NusB [Gemmatimonadota bacterium]MBK7714435.1 transcription antitermination factor NusB [Gemmatimonadota bacterium]
MLRPETKARARALQILYSVDVATGLPLVDAVTRLAQLTGPDPTVYDQAEALAEAVVREQAELDRYAVDAAENWRLERIAAVERNILRIGIHELLKGEVPPKVVIDEAVQLAHWFGGAKAPAFINGVLDRVARGLGRL